MIEPKLIVNIANAPEGLPKIIEGIPLDFNDLDGGAYHFIVPILKRDNGELIIGIPQIKEIL